jgi:hypothetical protein
VCVQMGECSYVYVYLHLYCVSKKQKKFDVLHTYSYNIVDML